MARVSLPPLGDIDIDGEAPIWTGALYEVWAGRLGAREVWCKTPRTHPAAAALVEGRLQGREGGGWQGETALLGAAALGDLPSLLLLLEAEQIRASRGAWNHRVEALGVWDLHWFFQPYLASEAEGRAALRPVLVTPRPRGQRLSALPPRRLRTLLPALLPALWVGLSAARHGNLTLDSIVYDEDRGRATLVDPGPVWWTRRPLLRDLSAAAAAATPGGAREDCDDQFVFLRPEGGAYPLLPPTYGRPMRTDWWLTDHLERLLHRGAHVRPGPVLASASFAAGEEPPLLPSPADLLAVGVMYFQILTGRHPLPGLLERPAWLGPSADDSDGYFLSAVRRLLGQGMPAPAHFAEVLPEEDALCQSLLHLHLQEGEASLRHLAEAVLAAHAPALS